MEPFNKEKVQERLKKIMEEDPDLAQSYARKRDQLLNQYMDLQPREEIPQELRDAGVEDISVLPEGIVAEESIALAHFRPVMIIRDNRLVPKFDGPDVEVWKDRLMAKKDMINSIIPSVGRVEVKRNAVYKWVGTGWMVDTDIIVTNRHVASIFSQNREGFSFKVGYPDGMQSANTDFLEEDKRNSSREFEIESVLWIAPNESNQPDVAFMRISRSSSGAKLPIPITLGTPAGPGETVVTIGYPARDSSIPDQDLVLRIFGNVYEKKRLAPGEIKSVNENELEHDCSTLGGNSGSVVLSLNTGQAVGLHFAGLYMQSNYAVPANVIASLLTKLKEGSLPGMKPKENAIPPNNDSNLTQSSSNKFVWEGNIPIKITIELGGIVSSTLIGGNNSSTSLDGLSKEERFEKALALARQELVIGKDGIISVEEGYRFRRGWITDEKVIAVEVQAKMDLPDLEKMNRKPVRPDYLGIRVDVRSASIADQLESIGVNLPQLEAVPVAGVYREPNNVSLKRFTNDHIDAIFHVSPDSGWPNLKNFLGRVSQRLTATMYEWEAKHISKAIFDAISQPNCQLKMVTQFQGTHDAVEEMQDKLGRKFQHVWASVGGGKIVPTAYHIKVATRDDEEFWLSSGNWKNSNQADIDPARDGSTAITPLRQKNREWHAIIKHKELATIFRKFIEWDFQEAKRIPFEEALIPEIFLFVPERVPDAELERTGIGRYFEPKVISRVIDIEPFLTPDRDGRGLRLFIKAATEMVDRAQRTIDIENQSFALLDDNDPQYERFYSTVLKKQNQGLTIRIIFRDPREFSSIKGQATLEKQLSRLKKFGLDTDNMKVQIGCHTKAIIIDSAIEGKGEVLFGSHNLTTSGALFNRDASLLVRDTEVARYYQQIFDFDWEVLATQSIEESVAINVAQPGMEPPIGYKKVSLTEYMRMFED